MAEKENQTASPKTPLQMIPQLENKMERMVETFLRRPLMSHPWLPSSLLPGQAPAVDLYEDGDHVVVKAEVPGLSKEDLNVNLSGSTLTIKGEKKKEEEGKIENYYYRERSHGAFTRVIELPAEVKGHQAKASFKDGVLEIRLPKTEEAKKKVAKIKIE